MIHVLLVWQTQNISNNYSYIQKGLSVFTTQVRTFNQLKHLKDTTTTFSLVVSALVIRQRTAVAVHVSP